MMYDDQVPQRYVEYQGNNYKILELGHFSNQAGLIFMKSYCLPFIGAFLRMLTCIKLAGYFARRATLAPWLGVMKAELRVRAMAHARYKCKAVKLTKHRLYSEACLFAFDSRLK